MISPRNMWRPRRLVALAMSTTLMIASAVVGPTVASASTAANSTRVSASTFTPSSDCDYSVTNQATCSYNGLSVVIQLLMQQNQVCYTWSNYGPGQHTEFWDLTETAYGSDLSGGYTWSGSDSTPFCKDLGPDSQGDHYGGYGSITYNGNERKEPFQFYFGSSQTATLSVDACSSSGLCPLKFSMPSGSNPTLLVNQMQTGDQVQFTQSGNGTLIANVQHSASDYHLNWYSVSATVNGQAVSVSINDSYPSQGGFFYVGDGESVAAANAAEPGQGANPDCDFANISGITAPSSTGYLTVNPAGEVCANGMASWYGDLKGTRLAAPIIAIVDTPSGNGYWLLGADGGIFTFGDAHFYGSTGGWHLNAPVVGMASTTNGQGYWIVAKDGGIFTFGNARFSGSTGNLRLNKPVDGMAVAPGGNGYWLVASDGGVFTFTQDGFFGSLGNMRLAAPIVGMSGTPDGRGYTLVGSDGGVFNFGDSHFYGSWSGSAPGTVVAIATVPSNNGYFLATDNGHVAAFGPGADASLNK